jgi:hypothetical protein
MVTVIVGVGVLAMMQLLAAGTVANSASAELTTGLNLANNVRELMQTLEFKHPTTPRSWGPEPGETLNGTYPYNDLDDFDSLSFSPPIDARRARLHQFPEWEQRVRVQNVDPDRLTLVVPNGTTPTARVTIAVHRNGREVCAISFLAVDAE